MTAITRVDVNVRCTVCGNCPLCTDPGCGDHQWERTKKRYLYASDESAKQREAERPAFAQLFGGPHIEHRGGRSFKRPGCAVCFGNLTVGNHQHKCPGCKGLCMSAFEDVGPMPAECTDGYCGPCTGVVLPAYTPVATELTLRPGPASRGVTHGALRRIKRLHAAERLTDEPPMTTGKGGAS